MELATKQELWLRLICTRLPTENITEGPFDSGNTPFPLEYSPPAGPPRSIEEEAKAKKDWDDRRNQVRDKKKIEFAENRSSAIGRAAREADVMLEDIENQFDLRWPKNK